MGLGGLTLISLMYGRDEQGKSFLSRFGFFNQLTKAECCGIVGYLGNRPMAGQVCVGGL